MRVLLVEDDRTLAAQVRSWLEERGYRIDHAADGEDGSFMAESETFDAIVLDLGLPKVDGLALLRSLRAQGSTTPVLILTARGTWRDRVDGLDSGADDYVVKPFHLEELTARLRALIRRSAGKSSALLVHGPLAFDTRTGRVTLDDRPVPLTAQETRLLGYFLHHPGSILTKTELTEHVYGYNEERDSNTLEVFVGRLRKKLGSTVIETVRGQGYRLAELRDEA